MISKKKQMDPLEAHMREEIEKTTKEIEKHDPALAEHLRKHIVFKDGTVTYTGNIKWDTGPPLPGQPGKDKQT